MSTKYILDDAGNPVRENDTAAWGQWFDTADRKVVRETVGESDVSTVFLGLDHSFGGPLPMVWETMVFGGALDQEQDRCGGNIENAKAMHRRMVDRVKSS